MQANRYYAPLKVLSAVVLIVMVVAAAYAFGISLMHWSGISV